MATPPMIVPLPPPYHFEAEPTLVTGSDPSSIPEPDDVEPRS
jgi:hypothetical protein